jgi:putative toxin-antitoxin system antitoxin component (TIGR02293 family)
MANDQETVEAESIGAIIERAVEVIGDREEAMRWLGTPVRALGYATPISLLSRPQGQASVLITLKRLEHGLI